MLGPRHRPWHELLLLLLSADRCSQTSSKHHFYNSCSKRTCTPAHGTKPSLTWGQGLAAITGPSAAPGKLAWVTWLWVKVCEQEVLNKKLFAAPAPASPSPVKVSNTIHSMLAARRWCPWSGFTVTSGCRHVEYNHHRLIVTTGMSGLRTTLIWFTVIPLLKKIVYS